MLIYSTTAGSRLYGYNREDSDYDYRGVFLAPAEQLLGLEPLKDTHEAMIGNNDIVNYELRKFARLALKGNPNILEILFSTKGVVTTGYWKLLHKHRFEFLSQQLRAPYSGFLLSEIRQLQRSYDPKAAANAWRIATNGITILTTGDFNPTFNDEAANQMRNIREGHASPDKTMDVISLLDKTLRETSTKLPEKPNTPLISKLIMNIYGDHYGTRPINQEW